LDEDLVIAANGDEAVRLSKELAENCPPGYFIVEDHGTQTVYYKNSDPPNNVLKTRYTSQHIRIAHREFFPQHDHHIAWDRMNTEASEGKRDYYLPKENIAKGVSAVRADLGREFRVTEFIEEPDLDLGATILRFAASGRHFAVRVSNNFNDDYASGQCRTDLRTLAPFLRASKDGTALVTSKGIE
jgi:hypothetical protein